MTKDSLSSVILDTILLMVKKLSYGFVILIVIALIGGIIYKRSLNEQNQKLSSLRQTNKDIALATNDPKVNQAIESLLQVLNTRDAYGSSKVDRCEIIPDMRGWINSNWLQKCYLRYTSVIYTETSDADALANSLKHANEIFGKPVERSSDDLHNNCYLYDAAGKPTLWLLTEKNRTFGINPCKNPSKITWDDKGSNLPNSRQSIDELSGFDNPDNTKNQVWLTYDVEYFSERLGCGLDILLCSNPPNKKPL